MSLYLLDSSARAKVISDKPLPKDTIDDEVGDVSTGTKGDGKFETGDSMGAEDSSKFETDVIIGTEGNGKLETGVITQTDGGTNKYQTMRDNNTITFIILNTVH